MTEPNSEVNEMRKVEELRRRLKLEMSLEMFSDISMFKRFLKARNHDVDSAEKMLRDYIHWRKSNKVDTISNWYTPHEVSTKYIPFTRICFDVEGSLVSYLDFGNMDTRGILKSVKVEEVNNFFTNRFEGDTVILKEQSVKLGKTIENWTILMNFENFPLSIATHKPSLETIGKMVSLSENYYPERLKSVIIYNASWFFQIGYAVIKPLLSVATLKKIKIFGKDGWKEEILKVTDANALPKFLGGNLTDPDGDPMCKTFVVHGHPVPETFYAINKKSTFSAQPDAKKTIINRLSKFQVKLPVLYPDSNIEWEFECSGPDIAFSVLYKESECSNLKAKEIIPKQKIDTSIAPESGVFKCEKAGTYYLEFDNTCSWIRQKELHYKARVISPNQRVAA